MQKLKKVQFHRAISKILVFLHQIQRLAYH